jgi:hypothetical protein
MPIGGTEFFGQNQSPRITTNYLNQMNRHGDPAPGVPVSTAQVSGSIVQPYGGFEGGKLTITNPFAVQFADPAVGPLYGGIYMYVQLDPLSAAPTRGQILYWSDELNYMVTLSATGSSGPNKIAGVALNATTPGNWDFVQVAGIASVSFSAAGAIGDPVSASGNQADIGTVIDETFLGVAVLTAPAANAVSPVQLNLAVGLNF